MSCSPWNEDDDEQKEFASRVPKKFFLCIHHVIFFVKATSDDRIERSFKEVCKRR